MYDRYDIKICFKNLSSAEWEEVKKICESPHVKTFSIEGENGIAQDIISFILEMSDNMDIPEIIKSGLIYDLIKRFYKIHFDEVIGTLIINGKRYINVKGAFITKKIGNIICKIVGQGDTLFGVVEKIVEKYNIEYHSNIKLEKQSDFNENFFNISIEDGIVFVNPNIVVYLTFFYFGSQRLSYLYMLLKGLISYNYIIEAEEVFSQFQEEYNNKIKRIRKFLKLNPQWITSQLQVALLHELGHHYIESNPKEYDEIESLLPSLLLTIVDGHMEIYDGEIYDNVKNEIFSLLENNRFTNELLADYFTMEALVNPVIDSGMDVAAANALAVLFCHSIYVEYSAKLDLLILANPKDSIEKRLESTFKESIKNRVRLLVQSHFISIYLKQIDNNPKAMSLYENLTTEPYYMHNEDLDIEFLKHVEKYHKCLRLGYKDPFSDDIDLERRIVKIESEIKSLISAKLKTEFAL